MSANSPMSLSPPEREAILELGSRGSGGSFDPLVMSRLFVMGLVEIRNEDRRLVLTETGRAAFGVFSVGSAVPPPQPKAN